MSIPFRINPKKVYYANKTITVYRVSHPRISFARLTDSAVGGTTGTTKLTVAGMVSAANKLMAFVGAPASIGMGDVPGADWTTIVSGTTDIKAPTGSGATVVELDGSGRVISIGYIASVTAK